MSIQNKEVNLVEIGKFMVRRRGSVNPKKFLDETFQLYSIPSYDDGHPELLKGLEIGSSKKIIENNDVLLSRIVPHIRRCWVINDESNHRKIGSGEWIIFNSNKIDPSYLKYFFFSKPFSVQFLKDLRGVGGSLLRANPELTGKIKIPIVPLSEQKYIADILDKADALRKKDIELLEFYERLKESFFFQFFGDPVLNNKKWDTAKIEELISFMTSGSRGWAKYYNSTGSIFLRINNIGKNEMLTKDIVHVNPPNTAEAKRTKVQPGDLLISITADLGRTAVIPQRFPEAFINQHLCLLRLNEKVNPIYVSEYLASIGGKRQIERFNKGGVKAGLNFNDIKSLKIPVPPIELQNKFERALLLIQEQKQQILECQKKSESLFQCLLQIAYKGGFNSGDSLKVQKKSELIQQ